MRKSSDGASKHHLLFSLSWWPADVNLSSLVELGEQPRAGDLARTDEDGYVSIVGRAKDVVITGGLNVYPKEIELFIDDLPGVRESAVIGVPHADFSEGVVAVVVPTDGGELDEAAIVRRGAQCSDPADGQ